MPLQGGEEERVLDRARRHRSGLTGHSPAMVFIFAMQSNRRTMTISELLNFFEFATQEDHYGFNLGPAGRDRNRRYQPTADRFSYDGKGDAESSIMLVKNFR